MQQIVTAALNIGADAIHPGFGFLSENSDFVRLCEEHGIAFIGPSADVIDSMGNKSHARKDNDGGRSSGRSRYERSSL